MSCAQILDGVVLIPVASDVLNLVNFLIFDVALASSVFALTGDIAGLVNSASALSGSGNRLRPFNPPFVGVGLTCTRKNTYRLLALTRAVVMAAVLATTFLIEGRSCEIETRRKLPVVAPVPGKVLPTWKQVEIRRLTLQRRSCMGRAGDETYYGELRLNRSCELRPKLMVLPTIYFGLKYKSVAVNPPTNCIFHWPKGQIGDHMHSFRCPGFGTVACLIDGSNISLSLPDLCEGVVLINNEGHFCEGEALFPGRAIQPRVENRIARCRVARGVNTSDTTWVSLRYLLARTLRDTMDAVYGAKVENITVRIASPENVKDAAEIKLAYFWIMGAVVLLIFVLCIMDIMLRARGLVPTAHNELGLGSLLKQISAQVPPHEHEDDPFYDSSEVIRASSRPEIYVQNDNGILRTRMSQK